MPWMQEVTSSTGRTQDCGTEGDGTGQDELEDDA